MIGEGNLTLYIYVPFPEFIFVFLFSNCPIDGQLHILM